MCVLQSTQCRDGRPQILGFVFVKDIDDSVIFDPVKDFPHCLQGLIRLGAEHATGNLCGW